MRNKILSLLVLLLTAASGAWAAQVELKLGAKIKNGDVLTFGDTRVHFATPCSLPYVIFSAVNTSTTAFISYNDNEYSITFGPLVDATDIEYPDDIQLGVGAALGLKTGQTQPPYVMVTEGTGTFADPFILTPYATYNCGGSPVDGKAICDASDPDAISLTSSDGVTWTLAEGLLDSDVELQVEYFKEPGLAWKGKIPEGGFDAYLGFFHPSALPSIKNPNALTGITYSSSNTEVATVDENTGVVTALKAGSTVITATFAGDENYEAASISYTLNIDNPAIVTLPTSTDEGGTVTLVAGAASEAHDGDNKIATNANLDLANTSRNIAVGDDGTIHVVYKNTESGAVMYKKSTDGVTFSEPVQVSAESGDECEVAVSSNGKVYVSYVANSLGYIAYSTDGNSFTRVQVSSGEINSIHLAVDGDYVYGIPRNGTEFYYSADGGQNYETHTGWNGYAYSDVLIDKLNNNVVVIKDEPRVVVRYSTDHGATFTDEQPVMNGADQLAVYYSTAAAGAGKVFISGSEGTIATVNYINATCTLTTIESTENRSLCADEDENVIVGVEQNGSLYYELSTDGAQTFGEKVLVSEGSSANAALNHHDGSLLYLFTKGVDLYLATKTGVISTETVIDNGDGTYTVMPGTQVTFIAKANDGYHVASWSNNVEVNDPQKATQTITVSGDLNISATFAENEYDITFAEGNPEPTKWTATPNPAKTNEKVNVKYTGERKVMGVAVSAEAGGLQFVPFTSQMVANWSNDYENLLTEADMPGFKGVTLEEAKTCDAPVPYNLIYSFDTNNPNIVNIVSYDGDSYFTYSSDISHFNIYMNVVEMGDPWYYTGTGGAAVEVLPVEGKTNEWTFTMPAGETVMTPIYAEASIKNAQGETLYATLKEAFAAVQNGDTLKLDWNVTVTEQLQTPITDGGVRFILDFNGYTLDGTALVYAISLNNNGDRMTFIDSTEGEMGGLKGSVTRVENAIAIFTSGRANAGYSAETLNYLCSKTEMTGFALADGKEFVDLEGGADANDGFTVRLAWKAFDFAIEAGRFTTFYADKNIALDESLAEGIEIYTITAIDTDRSTATLSALNGTIAAGTPMLVYNSNEDDRVVKILVTDEAASDAVTAVPEFKGTAVDLEFTAEMMDAADYYALSGGKAFAKVKGAGTIAKNQCWLQFDKNISNARSFTFIFDDETTKIGRTDLTDNTDKAWYTIDGRKIAAPTKKGIYILNGKKVVIK